VFTACGIMHLRCCRHRRCII